MLLEVAGATVAVGVAVTALPAIGFTSGGVAAGSYAATWMSTFGGYVAAESLFATCQSLGATGLGLAAKTGIAAAGAAAAKVVSKIL